MTTSNSSYRGWLLVLSQGLEQEQYFLDLRVTKNEVQNRVQNEVQNEVQDEVQDDL